MSEQKDDTVSFSLRKDEDDIAVHRVNDIKNYCTSLGAIEYLVCCLYFFSSIINDETRQIERIKQNIAIKTWTLLDLT